MPRILNHGQDAILGVFLGGGFIREDHHRRAGRKVNHLRQHVERGLGTARLRRLAQDDDLHAGEAGRVHHADQIRREDVLPHPRQGRHANHAIPLYPLARRQPLLTAHDRALGLGKDKAMRPARKHTGEPPGKPYGGFRQPDAEISFLPART